ncbi:oxalate:formate antiporter [Caballeronia sp. Lep1P3]|nr:oxalate:formate antiporter [Caballeronia sp. Lep1P3]
MNTRYEGGSSNKGLLLVFWLYVLIPLAWGVINTLTQAVKLFK